MLKVGKINYANALPVYFSLPIDQLKERMAFVSEVPASLNKKMLTGELDAGPISSFAYALNSKQYLVLPDLSVSSKGKVRSIFLFSKKPIHELNGASIALTSSSATSIALLKVILKSFIQIDVTYQTMTPSLTEMLQEHEAALLIGDDAIRANWQEPDLYTYDLGELWHKYTGKRMTFAVWVVQKTVASSRSVLIEELSQAFIESKRITVQNRQPLVEEACRMYGGSFAFWDQYFAGLSYDFTKDHIDGLETFYELSYQNGLLPEPSKVELWQPNKVICK
ncbi:menaquinone biosynthetic enzyme MqnA/MqnD family protein [Bacillus horti]|uniref:Chorismate dehydratase n=1 Tax=Caldalkalibacillus horti TaxID=77523 RepID=A0ABT9VXC5_9BACI|nr:menaquinone biosynthesis protein [Bacillus horti]MDQ0165467.1 chorismate dehydratase [Bacillus horti]